MSSTEDTLTPGLGAASVQIDVVENGFLVITDTEETGEVPFVFDTHLKLAAWLVDNLAVPEHMAHH